MSNEELVREIQAEHNIKENLALLYQQNLPFIRKIVKIFANNEEDIQDLLQESYFAIEKAAYRYDTEQGEANFLTYATYYLKSQCGSYAYKNHGVHIPTSTLKQISSYRKILQAYEKEHGELPTDDYIRQQMGISKKQYKVLLVGVASCYIKSLDATVSTDEDSLTLGETIACKEDFTEELGYNNLNKFLWQQVEKLDDPKQRVIINKVFREEKTQLQIAEELCVSGARVQQIESTALKSLRRSEKVKEIASYYGYGCSTTYNYTFTRFKNTNTSSVEFIALKHIELEERMKKCDDILNEIINVV